MINIQRVVIQDPNNSNHTIELMFIDENVKDQSLDFLRKSFNTSVNHVNNTTIMISQHNYGVDVFTSFDEFKTFYLQRCINGGMNKLSAFEKECLFQ